MNPAITCVSLELTTACDRACPECCCNIPHRPAVHHPWEYFEAAAKVIYGVERVHLSGGEPTYHPQFAEFVPDMRRLSGFQTADEAEANRVAFVNDFMLRPEFTAIYGGLTDAAHAAQFIAKLEQTAQVTLPDTVPPTQPGQPPQYGRAELIQKMATGQFTAAQTLRAFIEQKTVFDAFFFRAFVAMQYFGYLLRDPEPAGYNDWVDVLTNGRGAIPPGDFYHLIFGFIYSVEYRQRFGP